jgi:hypothetical protein
MSTCRIRAGAARMSPARARRWPGASRSGALCAGPRRAPPLAHHGLGGCVSAFRRMCRARSSSVSRAMAIPLRSVLTITGPPICWAAALRARVYITSVSGSRRIILAHVSSRPCRRAMTRGVTSSSPRLWPIFSKSLREISYIGHSRVSSMAPSFTRLPAIQARTPPAPCDGGIRRRPRSRPRVGLALELIRQRTRLRFRA